MTTLEIVNAMPHIDEAYRDEDGYWAITKPGFYVVEMGDSCHTAHEQTAKEFLRVCRDVAPCDCECCSAAAADVPRETSAVVRYRLKRRRSDGGWKLMERREVDFDTMAEAIEFKERLLALHGIDRPPPSEPDDPETWRPCLASASAETK